jgi:hypothetical protein
MMGEFFPSRSTDAARSARIDFSVKSPNAFPMLKTKANKQILMEKRARAAHPSIHPFLSFEVSNYQHLASERAVY